MEVAVPEIEAYRITLAQKSLADFVKQSWPIFEPEKPLQWSWHHDAICDHLEAVAAGDIRRLLITVPPRHTKSSIGSIAFPAWVWATNPSKQFLYASHDGTLALEHSVKCRRVVESDWYQHRWGHLCQLAEDQNQKTKYETTSGGARIGTSVGGSVTGKGGDIVVVDDPHQAEDADSAALTKMKAAVDWFNGTLSTRLNHPKESAIVIIMQRIHGADLGQEVIAQGKYTHINLPTTAEEKTTITMPRSKKEIIRKEGDLLWPDRFDAEAVEDIKIRLGSWKYAAQYQQRPAPRTGGIFKRAWWKYYKLLPRKVLRKVQSWDTAGKDKQENDYSACLTGAECQNGFYLTDLWMERVQYPELLVAAEAQYAKHNPNVVTIEDKSSGISLIQSLQRNTTLPIFPVQVDKDKVARANAVSPTVEASNVFLPANAPWVADFVDRMANFPNIPFDDDVDAFTQMMAYFLGFVKNKVAEPRMTIL